MLDMEQLLRVLLMKEIITDDEYIKLSTMDNYELNQYIDEEIKPLSEG